MFDGERASPGWPPAAWPASRLSSQSAICCIFGDIGFPFFFSSSSIRVPEGTCHRALACAPSQE